jgi:hypothetical protein
MSTQWRTLLGRDRMAAAPDSFAVVIATLRIFLMPVDGLSAEERACLPGGPWSLGPADEE